MARCSYHPKIETEMSCGECGKPICPKEMVDTPVGYKCPDCARPARSQYLYVKPKQMIIGAIAGLVAAFVGGFVLMFIRFGFFLISIGYGMLVGEAVRRGAGGHRGPVMAAIGVVSLIIGGFASGLGLFEIGLGALGVLGVLAWGWGR